MEPIEIYKDLKNKIIWLALAPETTLNHVDLAKQYGVSRNPIIIALTRLDAERWVVRHGSHYVVSPLTVGRMREITEIRSVMEVQAVVWAMNRMSPEGTKVLGQLKDEIRHLDKNADNRQLIEFDVRVHQVIYRESQNSQLAEMLENMLCHYLRFWLAGPTSIDRETFFTQTLEILRAIEEKDEVRLRAACMEHIKVSMDEIMGLPTTNRF